MFGSQKSQNKYYSNTFPGTVKDLAFIQYKINALATLQVVNYKLTSSFPQEYTLLLPVRIPVFVDHVFDSKSPLPILGVLSVVGDD